MSKIADNFLWSLMIFLILLAGGLFSGIIDIQSVNRTVEGIIGAYPVNAAVQYVCPMHPEEMSNDPDAVCGICNMNLVAVSGVSSVYGDVSNDDCCGSGQEDNSGCGHSEEECPDEV